MKTGKIIDKHLYLHVESLVGGHASHREKINKAALLAGVVIGQDFSVVKIGQDTEVVSLLHYPGFFDEGFPVLKRYWTVDLAKGNYRYRSYEGSLNPPILHRKELLLPEGHPAISQFAALTQAAEQVGLFDDPARIGFSQAWEHLLALRGYRVVCHELAPIGNDETIEANGAEFVGGVARHLTALSRTNLSAPIQSLARFGWLDGSRSVFDYGCGRGDDIRGLLENGIEVAGWDPYYAPDQLKRKAQIVNLGFVINVIENRQERQEALLSAYELAEDVLVVSAMIANPESARGKPYGDGVLTTRNTFQKYYTQTELRDWLADTLDAEPIAVGPGIFYVFTNSDLEQRFQFNRLENRRNVLRYKALSRPRRHPRAEKAEALYQEHANRLENLWETRLRLGRAPDKDEVHDAEALNQAFGNLRSAFRFIENRKDNTETIFEQARNSRIDDLKVYFADLFFQCRKPYKHLESGLQRDVKAFFGDYRNAQEAGKELLLTAANSETLDQACREAAERGLGWLEENHSLQLHTSLVPQLPAVLRVYINCGLRLYGDASSADLIKIHIQSGKLTLMSFDDFDGKPLPRLLQRVKLKLRDQDLDVFDYEGEFEPPYLYRKSRFLNEEMPHYAEQLAFDDALENLSLLDSEGYGPKPQVFDARLEAARWTIDGFNLIRCQTLPDLDSPCGQYFTYRDLIECGETQAATGLPNIPKQPDSYTALLELAKNLLDPVIDYFGMIRLTYGFCSPELSRKIPGRIAPKLDQHAACELNRLSKPICDRLGAAADFWIEDEDMLEVAKWIAANLTFDRMYIYDPDRPIHISFGPQNAKQAVFMLPSARRNIRVPKVVSIDKLTTASWPDPT